MLYRTTPSSLCLPSPMQPMHPSSSGPPCDSRFPICLIQNGGDTSTVEPQVFRPFFLAGASHSLIRTTITVIQSRKWFNVDQWFSLHDYEWLHMPAELLQWYLTRKPVLLYPIHTFSHTLPSRLALFEDYIPMQAVQLIADLVPFDLVDAEELEAVGPTRRNQCKQLMALAKEPGAPALLKRFTRHYDGPAMAFDPIPLQQRVQEARAIQSLLASIPPPPRVNPRPFLLPSAHNSSSWRTFLGSFGTHYSSEHGPVFLQLWSCIRDSNVNAGTLNAIPFGYGP